MRTCARNWLCPAALSAVREEPVRLSVTHSPAHLRPLSRAPSLIHPLTHTPPHSYTHDLSLDLCRSASSSPDACTHAHAHARTHTRSHSRSSSLSLSLSLSHAYTRIHLSLRLRQNMAVLTPTGTRTAKMQPEHTPIRHRGPAAAERVHIMPENSPNFTVYSPAPPSQLLECKMCVCVCGCVCVCVHCVCVCACMCVCARICLWDGGLSHPKMPSRARTPRARTHTHVLARRHIRSHTHVHAWAHTHMHTCVCAPPAHTRSGAAGASGCVLAYKFHGDVARTSGMRVK